MTEDDQLPEFTIKLTASFERLQVKHEKEDFAALTAWFTTATGKHPDAQDFAARMKALEADIRRLGYAPILVRDFGAVVRPEYERLGEEERARVSAKDLHMPVPFFVVLNPHAVFDDSDRSRFPFDMRFSQDMDDLGMLYHQQRVFFWHGTHPLARGASYSDFRRLDRDRWFREDGRFLSRQFGPPTKPKQVALEFNVDWDNYGKGEVATFSAEVAEEILCLRHVKLVPGKPSETINVAKVHSKQPAN